MAKYYKRGKFSNKVKPAYKWKVSIGLTAQRFVETLIVRGIGYRAFALKNDLLDSAENSVEFIKSTRPIYTGYELDLAQETTQATIFEFPESRYLSIRAGHTSDLYVPLALGVQCKTSKKDRKLAVMSRDKILSANLAKKAHLYRAPSVYTGRGVRVKHIKPIRKAGKKDKQKGKAF